MDRTSERELLFGRIALADDRLVFGPEEAGWEMRVADLAAIAELTIEFDPFGPDHFLCFVSDGGRRWVSAPAGALGMEGVLAALRARLDAPLRFGLANRVDFASRVMWPIDLAERPMFVLGPEETSWIPFRGGGRELFLAPELVEELQRRGSRGSK